MLEITAKELKTALGYLQNASQKRGTMPILQNIAIQGSNEEVMLTATDMEQQITFKAQCAKAEVDTTIEFDKLFKWSSKFKDDQILKFKQTTDEQITVTCGRNRAKFKSLPTKEFPFFSEKHDEQTINFNGSDLVDSVKKAQSMAANGDVRAYLNSVALDVKGNTCNVVATNGHCLIKIQLECVNESGFEGIMLIPVSSVNGFVKCLDEQPVSMKVSNSSVCFSDAVLSYATKLIDGRYPDYQRVIPVGNDKEFKFNCQELKESVNRAVVFGDGKMTIMKMIVDSSGNECNIIVRANDNTEADEVVSVISNHEIEMGLNATYLTDAVNKVSTEDISLMVKDANSAVLVEEENTTMVIMPARV